MDIATTAQHLGQTIQLVGLLLSERDRQKVAAIKTELTEKILSAQAELSNILSSVIAKDVLIQSLTQENSDLKAAQRERERYRLAMLSPASGLFAYRLRPQSELVERSDEPPHFLCQPCFDSGRKTVLRLELDAYRGHGLVCCIDSAHSFSVPENVAKGLFNP